MEKPDRKRTLREASRILKTGGIFSIAEFGVKPNREEKYKEDALIAGEYGTMIVRKEDGSEWFRSHNFTQEELESLIKEAGFEIVDYMNPTFASLHGNPHPGHQYLIRKV
jgi:ubiquinone/menaquinone biosynthesis C-methylase UbiE